MKEIIDMPKLESPFVREEINGAYIVTPKITEGYEWVFNTIKLEEYDDELPPIKKKLSWCMKAGIVIFALVNCIDLITTELALHANPDLFYEVNPIGAMIVPHLWLAITVKVLMIAMGAFIFSILALRGREKAAVPALYFINGYYTFVCISNAVQLKLIMGV